MEIKRGDIWYVSKDNNTGCEQAAGRPAIIVSNEKNNASSGWRCHRGKMSGASSKA